jgi:hypothetical protein
MTLLQSIYADLIKQACSGDPTEHPLCRNVSIGQIEYAYEQVKHLDF